jgi:uncharacterized lipoprotein YbaY
MKLLTLALAASCGLLLTACSDDSDDMAAPPVDNTVPASAQASAAAWTSYSAALPDSDTAEPLDVNAANPPVSETEEPSAV